MRFRSPPACQGCGAVRVVTTCTGCNHAFCGRCARSSQMTGMATSCSHCTKLCTQCKPLRCRYGIALASVRALRRMAGWGGLGERAGERPCAAPRKPGTGHSMYGCLTASHTARRSAEWSPLHGCAHAKRPCATLAAGPPPPAADPRHPSCMRAASARKTRLPPCARYAPLPATAAGAMHAARAPLPSPCAPGAVASGHVRCAAWTVARPAGAAAAACLTHAGGCHDLHACGLHGRTAALVCCGLQGRIAGSSLSLQLSVHPTLLGVRFGFTLCGAPATPHCLCLLLV